MSEVNRRVKCCHFCGAHGVTAMTFIETDGAHSRVFCMHCGARGSTTKELVDALSQWNNLVPSTKWSCMRDENGVCVDNGESDYFLAHGVEADADPLS